MENYLKDIKIPTSTDDVHKEECLLCFDNTKSAGGLNVCLNSFQGYCEKHIVDYSKKTGRVLFLNIKEIIKEKSKEKEEIKPTTKEDGTIEIDIEEKYDTLFTFIALDPISQVTPLPSNDVPVMVTLSCEAIKTSVSANMKQDKFSWKGPELKPSEHAENLVQINAGLVIPPSGWSCGGKDCEIKDNLWLCLTCGEIGCGRRNWDGSGGNNHGVEHYEQTAHPLVVKLGTITAKGDADVFSHIELDMVLDVHLEKHLKHFGLDMKELKKSAKSMTELEIDQSMKFESMRIEHTGESDVPLFGSGYTGFRNLGNTCYLASVMQCLSRVPQFKKRYLNQEIDYFNKSKEKDPSQDLDVQLAKLFTGLFDGKYSQKEMNNPGIMPKMFKHLIGQGHSEFSTGNQQDALEYFQHLITQLERNSKKTNEEDLTTIFKFETEERIECLSTSKVKYTKVSDFIFPLQIPLEKASNKEEYEKYKKKYKTEEEEFNKNEDKKFNEAKEKNENYTKKVFKSSDDIVQPIVNINDCIECYLQPEILDSFYSTAIKSKTKAKKTNRFSTFPDYLIISVNRYIFEGTEVKKLNASIEKTEEIDLAKLRGYGLQENEELLPEEKEEEKLPEINQTFVAALMDMSFPKNRAEKAVHMTGNSNVEAALEWIFAHNSDPDIDDPIVKKKKLFVSTASEDDISNLTSMGFSREHSMLALSKTNNQADRAVEWIFSHSDDLDVLLAQENSNEEKIEPKTNQPKYVDGKEQYELFGVISHIGNHTGMGHYVAFLKVEGKWVKFNDSVVESCEKPPLDLGYVYFYQRK